MLSITYFFTIKLFQQFITKLCPTTKCLSSTYGDPTEANSRGREMSSTTPAGGYTRRSDLIGIPADKQAVVLDIGSVYTKCGYAGEFVPRAIVPTLYQDEDNANKPPVAVFGKKDLAEDEQEALLSKFVHQVFYKRLLTAPKERRIVVVESVLAATKQRNRLARVLFSHLDAPTVLFAPSHLLCALAFGRQDGLVVDVGHRETLVLPVSEGVAMLNSWQASAAAGAAVRARLVALLTEAGVLARSSHDDLPAADVLTDHLIEDIVVRCCFATRLQRGRAIQANAAAAASGGKIKGEALPSPTPPDVEYPIDGDRTMTIPGCVREAACEALFERDDDSKSIPQLILDALLKCPIDLRKPMAERLIVCGGTAMLTGFLPRLKEELLDLLANDPDYSSKLALKSLKFLRHSQNTVENYLGWLGGSIFGSLDILAYRSLTREEFEKSGEVPDWTAKVAESCGADVEAEIRREGDR